MAPDPTPSPDAPEAATQGEQRGRAGAAGASAATLTYLPALDGLRGLAAAGVVLFHAQVEWMRGGFLAVTTFFALSGFLLTSLLLAEHRRDGSVSARAFWARRFRRLLPAALATLAGVALLAPWLATPEQLASLRGDALAALLYVANWRFVLEGRAYTDLFADPSPVQHFWTLSVEEQFFVVLPLVVLALVGVAVRRVARRAGTAEAPAGARHDEDLRTAELRRLLLPALGLGAVASALWLWLAFDPADGGTAAYYGTGTRASEFLLGALAAVALGRPRPVGSEAGRRALAVGGPVALVVLVWLWATTIDGSEWLYQGGFPLVAALSTVVLVATLQGGPLARGLGSAPLRELGRRSYGVYLFHWPVLLWLTEDRAGFGGPALLAVQLGLVAVLAMASFHYLEQPIRTRRRLAGRPGLIAGPVAMAAVAAVILVATADPPRSELVFDALPDPTTTVPADGATEDVTVLVVGDSLANNLARGLVAQPTPGVAVFDRTTPGCGLSEVERRVEDGGWKDPDPDCLDPGWRQRWSTAVAEIDPDVAVVLVGPQELWDQRIDDEVEVLFDTADGEALARANLDEAIDVLGASGAAVVVVDLPAMRWETWGLQLYDEDRSINNPAWVARWNGWLAELSRARAGTVVVAPLAAALTPDGTYTSTVDGVEVRAGDGLHLTAEGQAVAADVVLDVIATLADDPPG